jgi:hypothetical protein
MLYIRDMHIFELLTLVVNKTNSTMQLLTIYYVKCVMTENT